MSKDPSAETSILSPFAASRPVLIQPSWLDFSCTLTLASAQERLKTNKVSARELFIRELFIDLLISEQNITRASKLLIV